MLHSSDSELERMDNMAYTNQTEYYGLPQYVGSDRASWTDTNEGFAAVDTALHTAVTESAQAKTDIDRIDESLIDTIDDVAENATEISSLKRRVAVTETAIAQNTADITDVRQDLQDNIESNHELSATSTHSYAIGDYFYYNDVLYKATAVINIGDTIVPNTNCSATTVMDEMATIVPTPGQIDADDVVFNNMASGLSATDVQAAVDELADEKIDTFAGTVTDADSNTYTAVTADGIAYDATNEQLLLKVNGADTVIPFSKSGNVIPFLAWGDSAGTIASVDAVGGVDTSGQLFYGADQTALSNCDFGTVIYGSTVTFKVIVPGTYSFNGAAPVAKTVNETFSAPITTHHFLVIKTA